MKPVIVVMLTILLFLFFANPVQAQPATQVSGVAFVAQIVAGSLGAVAGVSAAKLLPYGFVQPIGGILGATVGGGVVGLALGGKVNWLLGLSGGVAGWFLSDFFAAGFFSPNVPVRLNLLAPLTFSYQDLRFYARVIGTAFIATIGFNMYV